MLKYPPVLAAVAVAKTSIDILRDGPADFPAIIEKGTLYTDKTFTEDDLTNGLLLDWNTEEIRHWQRLSDTHPESPLFGEPSTNWFYDVELHTSDRGVKPSLAAMGAMAKNQDLVKDKFITQTRDKSGIYAIRLYLKNKPWVLTIDNYLQDDRGSLKWAQLPSTKGPIWAPLLLKAWAKTIGSYYYLENNTPQVSALKAFTGCPTMTLKSKDFDSADALFNELRSADEAGYIMGVKSTGGGVLDVTNDPNDFSLLAVMTLTDSAKNSIEKLYLLRDPSSMTYDETPSPWDPESTRWTTELKNQLPFGIAPEDFEKNGLIILTTDTFKGAVDEVYVAHCKQGYSMKWYDVEGDFGIPSLFSAKLPAKDGDVYVSLEPFFSEMMPWALPTSILAVLPSFKFGWGANPTVMVPESDYEAGDSFGIISWVAWWGAWSDSSYTVSVYSKQDLEVHDLWGSPYEIHMDGTSPSGFQTSEYTTETSPVKATARSLFGAWEMSSGLDGSFWALIWETPWILAWWWTW